VWTETARDEDHGRDSQARTSTTQINLPRWNPNVVATRVAMALALVTGVALVAWLLMPIDSSPSSRRESESDFSYHSRPVVSPLVPAPTPPSPEPTPAQPAAQPTPAAQAPAPQPTPAVPEAAPQPTGLAAPLPGPAQLDEPSANLQVPSAKKAIERPVPAPRAKSVRASSSARPAAVVNHGAPTNSDDDRKLGAASSATSTATRTRTGTQTTTRTRTSFGAIPRAGSLSPDDF
jgi:hypothetical protein